MKVILAGVGAFGIKHLNGIKNIDGVEVVALVGRRLDHTREKAQEFGVAHAFTDLADALALPDVDAAILCTPTQMHAAQAVQCMRAGKHVQIEIPLADSWAGPPWQWTGYRRKQGPGLHGGPHAPFQPLAPVG